MTRSTEAKAPSSGSQVDTFERRRATWGEYITLDARRAESSHPRLTFDGTTLEIMNPSKNHEKIARNIGHLVALHCSEANIQVGACGSWTQQSEAEHAGLEPDESFTFENHDDPTRPDLAIEVVWTSGVGDKLELYARFRIPEVWIWKQQEITVHQLRETTYIEARRSVWMPGLDIARVAAAVYPASTFDVLVRRYR